MLKALKRFGSTAVPMHMALFNMPLNIALKFDIPLVVWGENTALEYGGTEDEKHGVLLDDNWLRKFGVTHGTTAGDWISDDLTEKELTPYFGPASKELMQQGIRAVFLGYYFPWDVETSLNAAKKRGFEVRVQGPKEGYYNYADIDCDFISIHHYIKWYKFGFTRLFDNLSLEIRNGRISRDEAIDIVKELGEQRPEEDIEKLCDFLGITEQGFSEVIETFRNHAIWHLENGKWKIRNFIITNWSW